MAIGLLENANLSDSCMSMLPLDNGGSSGSGGSPGSGSPVSGSSGPGGAPGTDTGPVTVLGQPGVTQNPAALVTATSAPGQGCPGLPLLTALPVQPAFGFTGISDLVFQPSPGGFVAICTCAPAAGRMQCQFDASLGTESATNMAVFASQNLNLGTATTPLSTTSPLISCTPTAYSMAATPAGTMFATGPGGPFDTIICGSGI